MIRFINNVYVRVLSIFARHLFPNKVRIVIHRLRGVKIGNNTFIGKYCYIDDKKPSLVSIGSNVGIALNAVMLVHRRDISNYSKAKGYNDYPFLYGKITIYDNVQIGCNSIILPNVTIGKGAIVGAGSVVTKDVPPSALVFGVPAKIVKIFDEEIK